MNFMSLWIRVKSYIYEVSTHSGNEIYTLVEEILMKYVDARLLRRFMCAGLALLESLVIHTQIQYNKLEAFNLVLSVVVNKTSTI